MQKPLKVAEERERRKCPYLDTVDRKVLDFDLEKVRLYGFLLIL